MIGATGAVGKDLLELLLNDDKVEQVDILVRKDKGMRHPKLITHVIEFEQPEQWEGLVMGDVAFSCLGTTLKAAGSKEAQWAVDYTYQLSFAKAAIKNGVKKFMLVSSMSANAQASFFYMRMKGQLEEEIKKLDFESLIIVRPPSLIRKNTDRMAEIWGIKVLGILNRLGLLRRMKPMSTELVAQRMTQLAKSNTSKLEVLEAKDIEHLTI